MQLTICLKPLQRLLEALQSLDSLNSDFPTGDIITRW